jgi:hypothetical protein
MGRRSLSLRLEKLGPEELGPEQLGARTGLRFALRKS